MRRPHSFVLPSSRLDYDSTTTTAPERAIRSWTVAQKARVLWEAAELKGLALTVYLKRMGATCEEYVVRCKGSDDNIVRWSPRLRAAWEAAVAVRATIRARRANKARPLPPPERRYIFVTETGARLSRSGLGTASNQLIGSPWRVG